MIAFGIFAVLRFLAFLFFSIVNDLTFGYNLFMCLAWFVFVGVSFYAWTLVYTLYLELSGLTRLEDLAHLRVSGRAQIVCMYMYTDRPGRMHNFLFSDGHISIVARIGKPIDIQLAANNAIHSLNTADALICRCTKLDIWR